MPPSFALFDNRNVALRILIADSCFASVVQEEFSFIEITPVSRCKIKLGKSHFGYLMAWNYTDLTWIWPYFAKHAVGISACNIKEFP